MEMENENRVIYKKIEQNQNVYRIQVSIGISCLSLIILHEINEELQIYKTAMILEQHLKKQAEELCMNLKEYWEKLISFFENTCKAKFHIDKNVLTITEDVNEHVHVKYFRCNLEKVRYSYIGSLIDDLQLQKSNAEQLQRNVVQYEQKLNELVERKKIDEQTMLSNFVLLLNEKKRRIQHLNELLEVYSKNPSLADPVTVNTKQNNRRKIKKIKLDEQVSKVKEEISETSSDSDISNDQHTSDPISKSDLFYESPSEVDSSIIKLPTLDTSENYANILPSTSKMIDSNINPKDEDKTAIIVSADSQTINTQEMIQELVK